MQRQYPQPFDPGFEGFTPAPAMGRSGESDIAVIARIAIPAILTVTLWLNRSNTDLSWITAFCSYLVLQASLWNFRLHDQRGSFQVPVIGLILGIYWWYFSLELFFGASENGVISGLASHVTQAAVTKAMVAVAMGSLFLLMGSTLKVGGQPRWSTALDIPEDPRKWTWLRVVLIVGAVLTYFPGLAFLLGEGARQFLTALETIVPTAAFVILFRTVLRGRALPVDKFLVIAFLGFRVLGGLSSGWLGSVAATMVVCGMVYLGEKRRVPIPAVVLLCGYVFFFQVGKGEFRQRFWINGETASPIEKVFYWVDSSTTQWQKALSTGESKTVVALLAQSVNRTSLLSGAADIIERTPSDVPFQYGQSYAYFLYTFIPRAIWPDKPSINDANRYYQVAYGLTSEDNLDSVSIAVGSLPESYMNFGWIGIPIVMTFLGIVLSYYQRTFLSSRSSLVMYAIGIALIPQFMGIEAQLAQYLGGVVQQVIACLIVFWPILSKSRARLQPVPAQFSPYGMGY